MAGTINLALSQQFDMDGEPLGGGLLYFFAAGTTTPQSAFQDQLLAILHPNPIVLDASGRVPMFYLADGNIKIRLTDDSGVVVMAADNLLVIGPSSGGGGGGGVDPTTVMAPGDIKARFGTGPLDGFVRCNGNTIGSAVSGSTERANADCQALFEYLWSTTVLQVFAGATPSRGATANADWLANKRMALPDLRGRTIAGMDDMGVTAASRLTSTYFGTSGIVLGNAGGNEKHALTAAELAPHTHTGSSTTGSENAGITHNFNGGGTTSGQSNSHSHIQDNHTAIGGVSGGGGAVNDTGQDGVNSTGAASADHSHTYSFSGTTGTQNQNHQHPFSLTTNTGDGVSGVNHAVMSPAMVMSFYIKL